MESDIDTANELLGYSFFFQARWWLAINWAVN